MRIPKDGTAGALVELEDNLYLEKGGVASNAQLVERSVMILSAFNVSIMGLDEVRENLVLKEVVGIHN